MHFRTNKVQPLTVKFLVKDEEQELKIRVNCMSPKKIAELGRKYTILEAQAEIGKAHEVLADSIVGWDEDVYEDDEALEFSKKNMVRLLDNNIGLDNAIAEQIFEKYQEQRIKNSLSSEEQRQNRAERRSKSKKGSQ